MIIADIVRLISEYGGDYFGLQKQYFKSHVLLHFLPIYYP